MNTCIDNSKNMLKNTINSCAFTTKMICSYTTRVYVYNLDGC